MIVVDSLGHSSFQLPYPTQTIADVSQGAFGPTRTVVREPSVQSARGFTVLEFPELPGGWTVNGPFGGPLVVLVRELGGIRTAEDALEHFAFETGVRVRDMPGAARVDEIHAGKAITIDLGEAGIIPGNSFVYLVPPSRPAIYFAPTHFLEFSWDDLSLVNHGEH